MVKRDSGYLRSFYLSAGAGAVFGIAAAIIYLQLDVSPWHPLLFCAGMALLAGLFSGLAGMGGVYLNQVVLRWGVQKPLPRMMLSFLLIALLFALVFSALSFSGVLPLESGQRYDVWMMLAGLAFGAVFALIVYRTERTRERLILLELENRHLAELAAREDLLREAARNLAVAEERNRMARELHDSISQGMHGIVFALRSLRTSLAGNSRGLETLDALEETAAATLRELRRLIVELEPSPLNEHGLVEALRLHGDLFARRQQIELQLNLGYNGGLQPEQEAALYRIAQEALANIAQHARAGRVELALTTGSAAGAGNKAVTLTIRDNGCGFDQAAITPGFGLKNMAARARQGGGHLIISSRPGAGTAITVTLPIQ